MPPSTSHVADQVGRVLGSRYRLVALLGSGASGRVFLADDTNLGRQVAVKLLHTALAGDEAFLRRFRAEAQAAGGLNHPHIMGVLDWGEDGDGPFLVLEHLGGGSLRDLLDCGHLLSPSQATAVGLEAARGLAYAHRRGLVHRDIKPANLLFDEEGRLCIADFGLARALAEAAWTEPIGALIGTARYSSPEAAQGRPLDGRADLYGLGLVLIEATTGQAPFAADTTIATLMARVGSAPEIPAALGPLGRVVVELTRPDPRDRPDASGAVASLETLARELEPPAPLPLAGPGAGGDLEDPTNLASRAVPIVLVPTGDVEVVRAPEAVGAPAGRFGGSAGDRAPARRRAARPRRRWPWVVLAAALAAALAGGGGAAWVALAVPLYRVPSLEGLTVATASSRVAHPDEFRVLASGSRYDAVAPRGRVLSQSPRAGAMLAQGKAIRVVVSRGPAPRAVPSLAGMTQAGAVAALDASGLSPHVVTAYSETVKSGVVVSWAPDSGLQPKGTTVDVTVSKGPQPRTIPASLVGEPAGQAVAALQGLQLQPAQTKAYSDSVHAGDVISVSPSPGQTVPRGATVTLTVSLGPHLVHMPDVTNQPVGQALAELANAGLHAKVYGPDPSSGTVLFTVPRAGSTVHYGATVDLYVL